MLGVNWLFVLGAFMLVSWLASRAAMGVSSLGSQYLGLAAFVAAQALIFVPLLYIANAYAPGAIQSAALVTVMGFVGLTAVAFSDPQRTSASSASTLRWLAIMAIVLIVASVLFGFELGTWFSVAVVAFAGRRGVVRYVERSASLPGDRYVGAAMQLFASIALMFWYVLRIFLGRRS